MIRTGLHYAAPVALALALAACGGNAQEAETAETPAEPVATPTASDPLEREYTLSEDQQAQREEFDEAAFTEEYAGYREEIVAEAEGDLPTRDDMNWGFLDRDDNGQLTLAEYAIWALPLASDSGEEAPELTSEQAGKLADSFFYYDTDSDSEMSQREFTVARSGDLIS